METPEKKDTLKNEIAKKNKIPFQKKKIEFHYNAKSTVNEISDLISDKLVAIIKQNVC